MKDYKNILTPEEKENICALHWNEGTLFEDEYYQSLMDTNEELKQVYEQCLKETCEELNYSYDDYLKGDIDFWLDDYDYDEFLLLLMQKLNDKLGVGLYD